MCAYTLRMPFGLAPGHDLKGLEEPIESEHEGLTYRLSRDRGHIVLRVSGLPGESEATEHIDAVWRGLAWCLVQHGVGFDVDTTPRRVAFRDEPVSNPWGLEGEFHGLADGDGPSVFPSDTRVAFMSAGAVAATMSGPAQRFLATLLDGIKRTRQGAPTPERVRTALDLFAAHFYEATSRAQLLTLATALEVLAEPGSKPSEVQELLDRWEGELKALMRDRSEGDPVLASLEALGRELVFRREASIRSRVRALPADVLGADHVAVASLSRRAVRAYDARSTLVHTGAIADDELGEALQDGRDVLKEMFAALLAGVE